MLSQLFIYDDSSPFSIPSPRTLTRSFAQKPLKHPLSFVSAQSILVIDPTEDNVVQRAMRVSPYLTPQTPELVKDSVKHYRKLLRQSPAVSACDVHTLEQLFLLSGDARYVRALDSLRTLYSAQQKSRQYEPNGCATATQHFGMGGCH